MKVIVFVDWENQVIYSENEKAEWIENKTEEYLDYENNETGECLFDDTLADYSDRELFFADAEKKEKIMNRFRRTCHEAAEDDFEVQTTEEEIDI